MAIIVSDYNSSSDTQSEFTLIYEKDYEKDVVDWVKLGFQGKTPETDFRATGTLSKFITDHDRGSRAWTTTFLLYYVS
jgi:hypothetical protein